MANILKLRRENLAPNLAQDTPVAMTVHQALLDEIDPNPFRDLKNAPLMETKVQALADHYAQHGAFPSVPVARQVGNRGNSDEVGHAFQNEAGHLFRTEAGRCSDLKPAT